MPADVDKAFYDFLDSIAKTGEEDAVQQNKRIKEAEFAEDRVKHEKESKAITTRRVAHPFSQQQEKLRVIQQQPMQSKQ